MKVRGQFLSPPLYPTGKEPPVLIGQGTVWAPEPVGGCGGDVPGERAPRDPFGRRLGAFELVGKRWAKE
jgi:hypothetical protein